jgi:hypothetical protein
MEQSPAPLESIESLIHEVRGQKVMLDSGLARLYEVETKVLNQAVKRNMKRFPPDFMFQLTENEVTALRSQFVTSNTGRGGRRYAPYVFTEQGVAMLSSVLNSSRAIAVNIQIMRVFIKMRHYALSQNDSTGQIAELRKLLMLYIEKNDKRVDEIVRVLNCLITAPPKPKRVIGFQTK